MSEDAANVGPGRPHRVVVLLVPPVVGFDVTIAPMILGKARDEHDRPLYEVVTAAVSPEPLETSSGYRIAAQCGIDALENAQTVIVPGTHDPASRGEGRLPEELVDVFTSIAPQTRIVSICTGAFVVAAAGLFDGLRATTHWMSAASFRSLYPAVELDESVLFVDEGRVLSSAGLAAGIDLCLHIIRRDHGSAVANRVARQCVVPPWREGGQAQFIERPIPAVGARSAAGITDWALAHLEQPLTVEQLAGQAHMSTRTFIRRFREETGSAPGAWLRDRRVDRARELLETTDLGVDAIAARSGLGSADNLRHHLRNELQMSPIAYRRRFRGA